jgi:signal peptidase I
MLPNLQRGDFIRVQGAPVTAYELDMTEGELESLTDRAYVTYNGKNISMEGSIFSYCTLAPGTDVCRVFDESPDSIVERKGAFTYRYETCAVKYSDGSSTEAPCLRSVTFKGEEYLTNFSNDVIVYAPPQGYLYAFIGDIVHRAMFKINVDGKAYYLTRGDNNPVLDIQVYDYGRGLTNPPVAEEHVRGKVIGRIPILGYFKLFISGYLQEDPQCRTQLEFSHV